MRLTLTGLAAAIGLMTVAAPAMACGYGGCCTGAFVNSCAQTYVPTYTYAYPAYTGCGACGVWGFEHLAEPTTQYYYVNQGPTYSGPGAFAPYPAYQEGAVPYYYGAGVVGPAVYGYRWHRHYRPWHHSYR